MSSRLPPNREPNQPQDPKQPAESHGPSFESSLPAVPAPSLPNSLSSKLQQTDPGRTIFVDTNGAIHYEKSKLVGKQNSSLVSFRAEYDGSFRVYAGIPPRNTTHCGSGLFPTIRDLLGHPELHQPVVLRSGDWLALAEETLVRIPGVPITSPSTAEGKLAQRIANAQVGDTVILGRSTEPSCLKTVSRAHITIKILGRTEVSPDQFELRVVAIPGIEGTHPIYEVKEDGSLDRIHGSRRIQAGGVIQVGDEGTRFTLPYPKHSFEEASVVYRESVLQGDHGANQSLMSVHGKEGLKRAQFFAAKEFVLQGIELIRSGDFEGAVRLLRGESKEIAAAGYDFQENNQVLLTEITPEAIRANLDEVARRSSFKSEPRRIYPSTGFLQPGIEAHTDAEHALLATWRKNLSLIYIEAFVQALQDMNGGAISDYTPILGGKRRVSNDIDVALFLSRYGVDLSDGYFLNSHPGSSEALQQLEGSQTPEEVSQFRDMILDAPLKTPIRVDGRIEVARTEDGYQVSPLGPSAQAFVLRPKGQAERLEGPSLLQGGYELFLGSRRFVLPVITAE